MVQLRNSAKALLRQNIKQILAAMSANQRAAQSRLITKHLLATDAFRLAKRVCVYLSMSTEVDTVPILSALFAHNKHVYVPCYRGARMSMVRLLDMADYEQLPLTKWKIRQPSEADAERREDAVAGGGLDLILVPGVAFEVSSGARLGHGMGYYDRWVHEMFAVCPQRAAEAGQHGRVAAKLANGRTVLMGLAFTEQCVAEVPLDEHDVRMDAVLTADGVLQPDEMSPGTQAD